MASHASRKEAAPAFSTGVNPLFDSQRSMSLSDGGGGDGRKSGVRPGEPKIAKKRAGAAAATGGGGAAVAGAAAAAGRQRSGDSARRKRTVSPQSTVTTSTTQSDGSRRPTARQPSTRAAPGPSSSSSKKQGYSRSAPASRNGSINKGSRGGGGVEKEDFVPAPLVPALLAPVPPPPSKRKSATDIETGEVGSVLEDAPDKTLMEMLQTYLKKQDLYTRMVLVVVLLVLAGGAMGAYAVMLYYAISGKNTKYIVLVAVFSFILFWVLWKVRILAGRFRFHKNHQTGGGREEANHHTRLTIYPGPLLQSPLFHWEAGSRGTPAPRLRSALYSALVRRIFCLPVRLLRGSFFVWCVRFFVCRGLWPKNKTGACALENRQTLVHLGVSPITILWPPIPSDVEAGSGQAPRV